MPQPNGSLILKEQAELEAAPFFPDFELPEIDKRRPKFNCTGDRLYRDRPDVYKAVVRLLAEPGVTIRTICQECHVTDDVVRSVKARENIPIAHEKKNVLASITHGLRLASERVIEVMPTASTRDALIGVGILGEKMQLLSGDTTARIEVTGSIDIFARLNELKEKLVASIEVPSDNGLEAENSAQKALVDSAETTNHGKPENDAVEAAALQEPHV